MSETWNPRHDIIRSVTIAFTDPASIIGLLLASISAFSLTLRLMQIPLSQSFVEAVSLYQRWVDVFTLHLFGWLHLPPLPIWAGDAVTFFALFGGLLVRVETVIHNRMEDESRRNLMHRFQFVIWWLFWPVRAISYFSNPMKCRILRVHSFWPYSTRELSVQEYQNEVHHKDSYPDAPWRVVWCIDQRLVLVTQVISLIALWALWLTWNSAALSS